MQSCLECKNEQFLGNRIFIMDKIQGKYMIWRLVTKCQRISTWLNHMCMWHTLQRFRFGASWDSYIQHLGGEEWVMGSVFKSTQVNVILRNSQNISTYKVIVVTHLFFHLPFVLGTSSSLRGCLGHVSSGLNNSCMVLVLIKEQYSLLLGNSPKYTMVHSSEWNCAVKWDWCVEVEWRELRIIHLDVDIFG